MKPRELEARLEDLHAESFGWALSCCGHEETEAEEVLQTTYLRVISGAAAFRRRSSFKTWLFGVIRRIALERARRTRREGRWVLRLVPDDVVDASAEGAEDRLVRTETSRALVEAMARLSPRQREVLHLVFYQDMTIKEASQVMGVSLGSARTHYQRGKERLRTILEEGKGVA